jgi:tryptophanyl-tRNA synthetase
MDERMTQDFETHPTGTAEEIRLSRDLARAIDQLIKQYGIIVPQSVIKPYNKLLEHYQKEMNYGK